MKYMDVSILSGQEIVKLEKFLIKQGYIINQDYKINYYGNNRELLLMNDNLRKLMKIFNKIHLKKR